MTGVTRTAAARLTGSLLRAAERARGNPMQAPARWAASLRLPLSAARAAVTSTGVPVAGVTGRGRGPGAGPGTESVSE